MLVHLDRSRAILVALILFNAAAVIGSRYFITLDGPLHVLRAELLRDHWTDNVHDAQGVHYDMTRIAPRVGDVVLAPFTAWLSPDAAHALYGALVLTALAIGAWMLAAACGHRPDVGLFWVLPLSFSWVFVLGFYPFLLAVALSMMFTAAWIRARTITWWMLLALPVAFVACTLAHRSGGVLLAVLLLCHEAMILIGPREERGPRWEKFPKWLPGTGVIAGLLAATVALRWILYKGVPDVGLPPIATDHGRNITRMLLLLDRASEQPLLIAFGVLFVIALATAVVRRLRMERHWRKEDGLLVASFLFLVGSVLIDPPYARLQYLPERAQFAGILLLAIWMAVQPPARWSHALMAGVLLLHLVRLNYVERRMATYRRGHDQLLACAPHLSPGGVVVTAYREEDWLLRHRSAYLAAIYPGVVFTSRDHLFFRWDREPHIASIHYLATFEGWWEWLDDHNAGMRPPLIQHMVVVGSSSNAAWEDQVRQLAPILARDYQRSCANGYAEVFTLRSP